MSALNMKETKDLQDAEATLSGILREGFDPKDESSQGLLRRAKIKGAQESIRRVVTMKGHYPN